MSPSPDHAVVELDELTITIVVDNATDTLSSISPGVPQLPEMAHLLGGTPSGRHDGHDCVMTFDQLCLACHGFSALATARHHDRTTTVLFDGTLHRLEGGGRTRSRLQSRRVRAERRRHPVRAHRDLKRGRRQRAVMRDVRRPPPARAS